MKVKPSVKKICSKCRMARSGDSVRVPPGNGGTHRAAVRDNG